MFTLITPVRFVVVVSALATVSAVNAIPIRSFPSHPFEIGALPERNSVNLRERNLPIDWCVEEGKFRNVKWAADVGSKSFGSPVVAHGRVFVATNNQQPRDPKQDKSQAVLMAFDEKDGAFLWQIAHVCPDAPLYCPGDPNLLMSTPTVDGRKLYYATPHCEVICADCLDGKIHWRHDLLPKLKKAPYFRCACSPLIVGDLVFLVTGHGVPVNVEERSDPDAPSFVALNKHTGKLVWESKLPGANIIHGQWSNPTFAVVQGEPQVIFGGGDGVIYGLVPETGALIWKCDCLPERAKRKHASENLTFAGTPVVVGTKLYIGLGEQHHGLNNSWRDAGYFLCLDLTKRGDVSLKSYDAKAPENKDSALLWSFGGPVLPRPAKGRTIHFGPTMSTAAVHDGLVYISERDGYLHCLDANTGRRYWVHDVKSDILGSPYWVDGKVYLAAEDGMWVFEHGKTAKVLAESIDMENSMWTTPTAANGVLFVSTHEKLYAIGGR
jgi:outer membrane protein assembly factor BamB